MNSRWEIWLIRAMLCLFMMMNAFFARFYLCDGVSTARIKWRYKKKHRLLDTGKQPKLLVWLLYTDIRSVRNQDFPLRLNMIVWIVAIPYAISELALGWLPLLMGMRIFSAVCAAFLGLCEFIAVSMDHKRTFGHHIILFARKHSGAKYESSIIDLFMLAVSLIIARCYFAI